MLFRSVLSDMLAQVLDHRGLTHLKGVALEADTKPIPAIVEEFAAASQRFGQMVIPRRLTVPSGPSRECSCPEPRASRLEPAASHLDAAYDRYAGIVTGQATGGLPVLGGDASSLALYIDHYLPYEILEWGGAVRDMFPETCRQLDAAGVQLAAFVRFWFREPRMTGQSYDFFLLKIERFLEFVHEALPVAAETARKEAAELQKSYRDANELTGMEAGR